MLATKLKIKLQSKTKFAIFCTLIAAIAFIFWRSSPSIDDTVFEGKLANGRNTPAQGAAAERIHPPIQLGNTETRQARSSTRSEIYQEYLGSRDLYATFKKFSADKLNPEARYFAAAALQNCVHFTPGSAGILRAKIAKESGGALATTRVDSLNRLQTECANFPQDFWREANPWKSLEDAATSGDPKSKAALLARNEPASANDFLKLAAEAQDLVSTKDPVVIDNLASYFDERNQFATWQIPQIPGAVSGNQIAAAMRLAACDFGYDCDGNSREIAAGCVRFARCDMSNRESAFQHYVATPEEYSRVLALRELIVNGISNGRWPEGFWTGSRRK